MSLSWASPIQSTYPHPTSWRSIPILSTLLRLGLPSGLFPSGFPTKILYAPSPYPYAPHAQPIPFFSILSHAQYWVRSTDASFKITYPHFIPLAYEDGTDRVFRNAGIYNSDAGELPKRKHNIFRTRRKFEIKITYPIGPHILSFLDTDLNMLLHY